MAHRRDVTIALGCGLFLPRPGQAAPASLGFRVLREGAPVGTHRVRFREEGGLLEAVTEVRVQVRLAGFTVYRYSHDVTEQWRNGRLLALVSRLDRNGTRKGAEARAEAGGIMLRGGAGEQLLPAEAAPLTWWRAATLRPGVPLFDPREGRAVAPRLELSSEAGGQRVRLVGGEGAEVLYDRAGEWIGFATTGEDGSAVRYERA